MRIGWILLPWNDFAAGPGKAAEMEVDGTNAFLSEDEIALMLIGDDHEIAFACPSTFVVFKTGAAKPAIDSGLHRMRVVRIRGLDFRLADDEARSFLGGNDAEELDLIAKDEVGEVAALKVFERGDLWDAPPSTDEN